MRKYFAVLILFAMSCSTESRLMESAQYSVDLDEIATSPSPFKVDIRRVIPLETTDESVISDIKKAVFKNNQIYIQDRSSHKLRIFSIDGKYIGSLSRQGRGPGEYIKLTDFDVDKDYIYVLSADNKKIIQYDYDDFNKSVEIKVPEAVSKIHISDGNIWAGDIFTYQGLNELALLEKGASSRFPTSGNIHDENSFNGFYSIYRMKDMLFGNLWGETKYPFLFVMNLKSGTSSLCDLNDLGLPGLSTITSFEGQFVTFISAQNFISRGFESRLINNIDIGNMDESNNPVAVMFSLVERLD